MSMTVSQQNFILPSYSKEMANLLIKDSNWLKTGFTEHNFRNSSCRMKLFLVLKRAQKLSGRM
jgi:hypothetical protein